MPGFSLFAGGRPPKKDDDKPVEEEDGTVDAAAFPGEGDIETSNDKDELMFDSTTTYDHLDDVHESSLFFEEGDPSLALDSWNPPAAAQKKKDGNGAGGIMLRPRKGVASQDTNTPTTMEDMIVAVISPAAKESAAVSVAVATPKPTDKGPPLGTLPVTPLANKTTEGLPASSTVINIEEPEPKGAALRTEPPTDNAAKDVQKTPAARVLLERPKYNASSQSSKTTAPILYNGTKTPRKEGVPRSSTTPHKKSVSFAATTKPPAEPPATFPNVVTPAAKKVTSPSDSASSSPHEHGRRDNVSSPVLEDEETVAGGPADSTSSFESRFDELQGTTRTTLDDQTTVGHQLQALQDTLTWRLQHLILLRGKQNEEFRADRALAVEMGRAARDLKNQLDEIAAEDPEWIWDQPSSNSDSRSIQEATDMEIDSA